MKKAWRIVLIVLLIVLITAAALAWHYRDYLRAFSDAKQYSSEDLQQQLDDNQAALEELLSEYLPVEPSEQETIPSNQESTQTQQSTASSLPESASTQEQEVAEELPPDPEITAIVAAFYQLRDEYGSKLEDIKARAYEEYRQTKPSKSELPQMALKYVREATLLEVECDQQVLALLDKLSKHIKNNGGDESLPEKILELYLNEKRVKKAWYYSELEKRGLVL